jgi:Tfp pilus assembly protein PilF
MNSRLFPFLAVCLGLCLSLCANAQGIGDRNRAGGTGDYSLQGKVILPDGKPAINAKVSVSGADFTNLIVRTDRDGAFNTGGIPAGNYSISVQSEGFPSETEMLTIDRDTPSGRTFNLVVNLRMPGQSKAGAASNSESKSVPAKALEKYRSAIEKASNKDMKAALSLLEEAIGMYPDFAEAYYERGAIYLSSNDLDKAVESFVKAVTIRPDYFEAKYGYGKAMFEKKNYEVAEAVFRDVLKQKNDLAEAHLNLGISLFYLKNGNEAETELKTAIATSEGDKFALGHLYLGQIYLMKNQNTEAVAELQKYIDRAPNAPNVDKIKAKIAELRKQR